MMKSIKLYVFDPVQFFVQRVRDEENRLVPFIILAAAVCADLLNKTVIFYKIGQGNIKSQAGWAQIGGGYFGSIIGQEIGIIEKALLVVAAVYLISRFLKNRVPMAKVLNLFGYCFVPSVVGSLLTAAAWQRYLKIGAVELSAEGVQQVQAALLASPAYVWQRVISVNVLIWTGVLLSSVMAACWGTRFVRTLVLGVLAVASAQGTDMLLGLVLKKFGVA
ncbi:MAG: hypothetical protein DMF61_02000 [Blastocatellia bacterium AA13]|nr:MAG: hypothetical protein DMF61_02000 [Blastocatellia bacterium AA13]